jgi:hypothetical protein
MIECEFNIITPEKFNKRKVWKNFTLTSTALWILKTYLDSTKSKYVDDADADEKKVAKDMMGSLVDAYLVPDVTNTGNPTNNINNFREPHTGTANTGSATVTDTITPGTEKKGVEMFK